MSCHVLRSYNFSACFCIISFGSATLEDKFDRQALPKVMQVKKFGFAGRLVQKNKEHGEKINHKEKYSSEIFSKCSVL